MLPSTTHTPKRFATGRRRRHSFGCSTWLGDVTSSCRFIHPLRSPMIDGDAVYFSSVGTYTGTDDRRAAFERTWAVIRDEDYSIEEVRWLAVSASSHTSARHRPVSR
jgi:hypothetical protein